MRRILPIMQRILPIVRRIFSKIQRVFRYLLAITRQKPIILTNRPRNNNNSRRAASIQPPRKLIYNSRPLFVRWQITQNLVKKAHYPKFMKTQLIKRAIFALVVGLFLTFNQTIKAQSALDGFDPNADNRVYAVAALPDGKVLIGGDFVNVGGQSRTALARLNADGTLDTGFNANITSCCTTNLRHIELLADGKILIAGTFSNVGAFQTYNVARLNADGSADTTFTSALNGGSGTVIDIERQSDGKLLIAGSLGTVGGVNNRIMLRLNTDGSNDSSFNNVTVDSWRRS